MSSISFSKTECLERFAKVRRGINLIATHALKHTGLGPKQAILIRHLHVHQHCSLTDLARETLSDPAAIGRAIDGLIDRGIVRQTSHPTDRRRWMLDLTSKGKKLAVEISRIGEAIAEESFGALTAAERNTLGKILEKLLDTIDENRSASSPRQSSSQAEPIEKEKSQ